MEGLKGWEALHLLEQVKEGEFAKTFLALWNGILQQT